MTQETPEELLFLGSEIFVYFWLADAKISGRRQSGRNITVGPELSLRRKWTD